MNYEIFVMTSFQLLGAFLALILCHAANQSLQSNETSILGRQKRAFLFPSGGTFKLVIGLVTPVKLSKTRTIAVGWNFQYQYMVPANTTAISTYPPILSRQTREDGDLRMNEVYDFFENELVRNHGNQEDCLLKYICEEGYSSYNHEKNGIYGYILHMLLSPNRGQNIDAIYLQAQEAGKFGADCTSLYSKCEENFLFDTFFPLSDMNKV